MVIRAEALGFDINEPCRRRCKGANTIASTVPHKIAAENGHNSQTNNKDVITSNTTKVRSSSFCIIRFTQEGWNNDDVGVYRDSRAACHAERITVKEMTACSLTHTALLPSVSTSIRQSRGMSIPDHCRSNCQYVLQLTTALILSTSLTASGSSNIAI